MGSQAPRTIRLSDLSPPPLNSDDDDKLRAHKTPLNVVGSVKEKGFSTEPTPLASISFPQPRLTPFPVARHRSDGPHWGPPSIQASSATQESNGDEEGGGEVSLLAEPLPRRNKSQSSQWRSGRKSELTLSRQNQNVFDDNRQQSLSQEIPQKQASKVVEVGIKAENLIANFSFAGRNSNGALEQKLGFKEVGKNATAGVENKQAQGDFSGELEKQTPNSTLQRRPAPREERKELGEESKRANRLGPDASTDREIDAENRNALSAMSAKEVAEAQAELTQKIRPELLELLRKQGAAKEKKRLAEKTGSGPVSSLLERNNGISGNKKDYVDSDAKVPVAREFIRAAPVIQKDVKNIAIPSNQAAFERKETVRGTKVGPADLLAAAGADAVTPVVLPSSGNEDESTPAPATTDPWTLRVEAVRSMQFGLDGSFVSTGPSPQNEEASQSNSAGSNTQHSILSVVERDYLRTEGDPVGTGYSLKEAVGLVRSTVPGQRAAALHLIASVLEKAIHSLQTQTFDLATAVHGESIGGPVVDWQAVWAYALGPEAELVLTLRLALDDGHFTVVAACARAIQALLSYSANESYFDSLEALWPGNKVVFTAPIFRRKTKQNEGFIGGGRWKYNVKSSEMFPFSDSAAREQIEEDGKDTVADDGHVSNKDVAAGLIRMGVLPRIRFILEVDRLIAVEEALLSILICMARHSPAAANAVMKCPRLIDAILQRFIGTNGHFSEESWSAKLKAIRLLKVLSQAKRSNCVHLEGIGILQTVITPLLRQSYVNLPQSHAQDQGQGYYETMIETVRFWQVCIDYGMGISLFSDCYSTLCGWLLPLSREEILKAAGRDEPLLLAIESYSLLERMARTLPLLHAADKAVGGQEDLVNWSWGIAQVMVDSAMKWLTPECISGVHELLVQWLPVSKRVSQEIILLGNSTRKVLGIMAAVLHFLATVCEKVVSESKLYSALDDPKNFSLPWLPTFLPQLGLVLARSGLLDYSQIGMKQNSQAPTPEADPKLPESKLESGVVGPTFLECLHHCQTPADHDFALVAINCLNGLVRVSGTVDRLIHLSKPNAIPSLVDQTVGHKVLEHGLLPSAELELRNLLVLCEENVTARKELMQVSVRGGPAPGLGIGWGSFCGGAWSKEILIAQASATLALALMSVFSSTLWADNVQNQVAAVTPEGELSEELTQKPSWRVNFGLDIVATSTTVNRELVNQVSSNILFHHSTLSVLIQNIEETLASWRGKRAQKDCFQAAEDQNLDSRHISKVLLQHCKTFWLAVKVRKGKEEVRQGGISNRRKKNGLGPNLATVDEEESGYIHISRPDSLMREWAGQRMPLPSHWFLSPMVVDLVQASKKDWESGVDSASEETAHLEEVIKAGLAFFLGLEALKANNASEAGFLNVDIPLTRKIHSLSTIFVSGGDVFLDPRTQDLIRALQDLIGNQIGKHSTQHLTTAEGWTAIEDGQQGPQNHGLIEHGNQAMTLVQGGDLTVKEPFLDFEASIDPSYLTYAEAIAEQFVASSYGDIVFGRQVALYLCVDVPDLIQRATWRVLTDGRVLELLPPLSQCCGPLQIYLVPIETNQQILESFVSSWASGTLDKAAKRNSLSFTLALHHLAGYLFDNIDTEETLLLKKKMIRTLVRSTIQKVDRQEMLSRLVRYVPAWPSSNSVLIMKEAETTQLKVRLLLMSKACEGDWSLTTEVQRLQKHRLSRT